MKKLAIGIDIGGINTAFGLVDENGDLYADSVVSTKKFPLFTDYPAYVAELTESLHALADSLSFEYELVGIGIGAPNANYHTGVIDHPANLFVAGFIGMPQMNFFDAKLTRQSGRYAVTVGGVTVELSDEKQQRLAEHNVAEQDVTLGVRPDHLMLCADGIKGTVDVSEMMGSSVHLHVAAEGKDVIVIVPTNGAAAHFPMGSEVNMIFGGNVAHVFDKETGKNLEW